MNVIDSFSGVYRSWADVRINSISTQKQYVQGRIKDTCCLLDGDDVFEMHVEDAGSCIPSESEDKGDGTDIESDDDEGDGTDDESKLASGARTDYSTVESLPLCVQVRARKGTSSFITVRFIQQVLPPIMVGMIIDQEILRLTKISQNLANAAVLSTFVTSTDSSNSSVSRYCLIDPLSEVFGCWANLQVERIQELINDTCRRFEGDDLCEETTRKLMTGVNIMAQMLTAMRMISSYGIEEDNWVADNASEFEIEKKCPPDKINREKDCKPDHASGFSIEVDGVPDGILEEVVCKEETSKFENKEERKRKR